MKKLILSFVLVLGSLSLVSAQQNAIGLKFGGTSGNNADISFQHFLNDANRLEFNLGMNGFGNDATFFVLSGAYQWVWDLSQLAPGFKWYAGVGAMAGMFNYKILNENHNDFYLWAIGNVGIEYNFEFPLQLALDWTPALRLTPDAGDFGGEWIKLAARWRF